MKQSRYPQIIIILLIISNILLIAFVFLRRPPHPEGPKNLIIERLHFDKKQIGKYDLLIEKHRKDISENEDQMMNLKSQLYKTIETENTSQKDSLIRMIGKKQEEAELINYQHFVDIKKLCKPDQQKDFAELVNDLGNLFSHKGP
jgi:protein CpxP